MSDRSERTNRIGYIVSAGDFIVASLAVVSIAVGSINALAIWVIGAIVYLVGGAIIIGAGAMGDLAESRAGAAEVTSWIFPLVASLAGINAALVALLGQNRTGISWDAVLGAVGIIVSWVRPVMATFAPSATSRSAMARPIPRLAAVTIAGLPADLETFIST